MVKKAHSMLDALSTDYAKMKDSPTWLMILMWRYLQDDPNSSRVPNSATFVVVCFLLLLSFSVNLKTSLFNERKLTILETDGQIF